MLKELIEYFNAMKKAQSVIKVELSEIKKNLQGTNCGWAEAKIQINDLGHKEEISIQAEKQEFENLFEKMMKENFPNLVKEIVI